VGETEVMLSRTIHLPGWDVRAELLGDFNWPLLRRVVPCSKLISGGHQKFLELLNDRKGPTGRHVHVHDSLS